MKKVFLTGFSILLSCFIFSQEITSFSSNNNAGCSGIIFNDPNITAVGICRGPGVVQNGGGTFNSRNWTQTPSNDLNDYLEWTITPNVGYQVNLSSMDIRYDRSNTGPSVMEIQMDTGSGYSVIYSDNSVSTSGENHTIDLTAFSNLTNTITFRLFAHSATNGNGTFDIEEHTVTDKGIIINGTVTSFCNSSVSWNGSAWVGGTPNINRAVIIDGDYNTASNGSFSACSLTVNSGTLAIGNDDYIEVQNDLITNGTIIIRPQGAFVQNNDLATVTGTGNITVEKETARANNWYEYTYWSSPVNGVTISNGLSDAQSGRIFGYNAQSFLDATMETNNNNVQTAGQDGVDDNADDWQLVSGATIMTPGLGYASTHDQVIFESSPGFPKQFVYTFEGNFNNGVITVPLYRNDSETNDTNLNFIGNPYPSAISADDFFALNSDVDGAIYLWSQNTAPSANANGNEPLNFSDSDYAMINSTGQSAGGDGIQPNRFIPSGQGFFVAYSDAAIPISTSGDISEGSVTFNNSLRVRLSGNNSQFFKSNNPKSNTKNSQKDNKLWLNLTSNNGVFNQVMIGYVDGATSLDDGNKYDAQKITISNRSAILYTTIKKSDKKFAIQGKSTKDLTPNEKVKLGFSTAISVPTLYKLSIDKLQGEFLMHNTVYLKDRLLKKTHDLSNSDYTFTSEVGEFNDRFEISFKGNSSFNNGVSENKVTVVERNNGKITFSTAGNFNINLISIYDFSGNLIYKLEGNSTQETFELFKLKKSLYIVKVELSSGDIITKKFIKK